MAFGARPWSAGGLIAREAAVLAAIGLAIALPASWALGRLVESQLFGIQPMDGLTLATAVGLLLLVSVVAGLVPARKTMATDPLIALRSE